MPSSEVTMKRMAIVIGFALLFLSSAVAAAGGGRPGYGRPCGAAVGAGRIGIPGSVEWAGQQG